MSAQKSQKTTGKTMVDQFNLMLEIKKKAKENKARGPVDIKALRQEMADKNRKNRLPS